MKLLNSADFRALSLSNRQFSLLRIFQSAGGAIMPDGLATDLDQRTFQSLINREWVAWSDDRGGYILTEKGQIANLAYGHTDIRHRHATHSWTQFARLRQYAERSAA